MVSDSGTGADEHTVPDSDVLIEFGLAQAGRVLEMNTRRLWPWIPQWWSEEGGRAVTFGSDAHVPGALADNFPEAVAMVEHFGFRPGRRPEDFWIL